MDAVPKENLDILRQTEIVIPKDTAKAFGRGLRQRIGLRLEEINSCLPSFMNNPKYAIIEGSVKRITNVLDGLEKAKEVRILVHEGGNDFQFSGETEDTPPFTPGEVLMDTNITPKFISALNHTVSNPLNIVLGVAQNMQSKETKKIVYASNQIARAIKSLANAQNIKMITDIHGNTTITRIHRPDK